MNRWKKGILGVIVLGFVPTLTACSFKETIGILWNDEKEESTKDEEKQKEIPSTDVIDEKVEKPVIGNEFGQIYNYDFGGEATPMTVEATVNDGGTLSYQWYRNNVDSNGGGTAIEGAVESTFIPSTQEAGINYYYVVVTNTMGKGVQMEVSGTNCVTVSEEPAETKEPESAEEPAKSETPAITEGWKQTDGKWWYQNGDGTYPSGEWKKIGGEWYLFDEHGYITKGWYKDGDKWYYFNENGAMVHDTEVEGYYLGSNGVMQ